MRQVVAWGATVPLIAFAVLRVGGLERGYPLVPVLAFTPYLVGAGVLLVGVAAVTRVRVAAVVAAAAWLALVAVVAPRAIPDGAQGDVRLRVLSANVAFGDGDADWMVRTVRERRIDLLSIQELTPEFDAELRAAGIEAVLPHSVVEPRGGAQGTGLYARRRLAARPRIDLSVHAQAVGDLEGVGRVVAVHTAPPIESLLGDWRRDLRALPRDAVLLVGDFNATLDHVEMRRVLGHGYADAAATAGAGLRGTWSSSRALPKVTIDHVLSKSPWRAAEVEVLDLPRSDHEAVYADLRRP